MNQAYLNKPLEIAAASRTNALEDRNGRQTANLSERRSHCVYILPMFGNCLQPVPLGGDIGSQRKNFGDGVNASTDRQSTGFINLVLRQCVAGYGRRRHAVAAAELVVRTDQVGIRSIPTPIALKTACRRAAETERERYTARQAGV